MKEETKKESYFQKIGKRGGKATAEKHGPDHMRKIGKRGGTATKKKYADEK